MRCDAMQWIKCVRFPHGCQALLWLFLRIFGVVFIITALSIKGVAYPFSENLLPITLMAKNPDDKHSLTGIINKVEDDGRIEQFFQDQFLSIVDSCSCVHPKITSKGFSFSVNIVIEAIRTPFKRFSLSINLIMEVVGPFSSKAKFNTIRYVGHIINGFP